MTAPLKRPIDTRSTQIQSSMLTDFMQTVQCNYALDKFLMPWADVNQKDSFGFTPLYWAISHHNMHNLKLLIEHGATLDVTSNMNALFYAIDCDNLEALQFFIDKGIDKNISRVSSAGKRYTLKAHAKRLKRKIIVEYLS